MNIRSFSAALLTGTLLLFTAACGTTDAPATADTPAPTAVQTVQPTAAPASTPKPASASGGTKQTTAAGQKPQTPAAGKSAGSSDWKTEFEKSLLENYGVTPDHYEDLGGGVYQVYVKIDGKVVPYVAVDSATGDYHG